MTIIVRLTVACSVVCALAACVSSSLPLIGLVSRHYRGVVRDARSKVPIIYVDLAAYCQPSAEAGSHTAPVRVATARTGLDGSFDIIVPIGSPVVTTIRATLPPRGDIPGTYSGELVHVSDREQNVVFIHLHPYH